MAQIDSSSLDFPRGAPAASERSVFYIYEHRKQGRNKAENQNAKSEEYMNGGADGDRTRDLLRDRQAF